MAVRIGVAFDGFVTTSEAIALAKHAVDAGAKSLWVAEHLGYREAITTCAAFALSAPGPILVPTAVSPYLWHATPTAMALATLDELAPGRVAVALGVGNPLFLQESGQKLEKPDARDARVHRRAAPALDHRARAHGRRVRQARRRAARLQAAIRSRSTSPPWGPTCCGLTGRIADGVALSAGLSTDSVRKLARPLRRGRRQGRAATRRRCGAPATSSSAPRTTRARRSTRCAPSSHSSCATSSWRRTSRTAALRSTTRR